MTRVARRDFTPNTGTASATEDPTNIEGATAAPWTNDQDFEFLHSEPRTDRVDEALAHLIDMGFDDENINRFMLIKNGLDIASTVNDLISERDAEEAIVREQPRSASVNNNSNVPTQSTNHQSPVGNNHASFLCDFD